MKKKFLVVLAVLSFAWTASQAYSCFRFLYLGRYNVVTEWNSVTAQGQISFNQCDHTDYYSIWAYDQQSGGALVFFDDFFFVYPIHISRVNPGISCCGYYH